MQFGAQPQCAKHRERNNQHNHTCREAHVKISVSVVHIVMTKEVPRQQRKNGYSRGGEKREECRRKCKQQTGKKPKAFQGESEKPAAGMGLALCSLHRRCRLSRLEYSFMPSSAQIELWPADKVAAQVTVGHASSGIHFAAWGETRVSESDLERLVAAVPGNLAPAISSRCYYFVPLAIADTGETMVAPAYSVDLGDRAVCHRNAVFGITEAVFISTRLVEDRFGLAFEFFINVAHNFVEVAGVPESFSRLVWSQAEAQVRGESSQDAWEARRRAQDSRTGQKMMDERARTTFYDAAFSDALAIYMLSLAVDFDYHDLREREYPLLAAPALAERLRHVANLFPANQGFEFQILYRRKG